LWNDGNVLGGIVEYCLAHGIPLLAYRPLGGPEHRRRIDTDPVLAKLAADRGATASEIALAALADLSPLVWPLPGPTRVESVRSVARAARVSLTDEDRAALRDRFPTCRSRTAPASARLSLSQSSADGEIVLVMGLPGAGKSTVARQLAADGYTRLNRDEAGGSLASLLPVLDRAILAGTRRLVLDNTYVTRKARGAVIQAAHKRGLPVRCLWVSTSVEDAQVNAVTRIVSRYGRLLGPEEMKTVARKDVAAFPPGVQFRYQRELEPPDPSEGFSSIETVPFERREDPAFVNRAVIVWCDGVLLRSRAGLRTPRNADDVAASIDRGAVLRRYADEGWKVLGLSWIPEISERTITPADADAVFTRLREALGVPIEVEYCPHPAGPPVCWCRKPLPGLGVVFQHRHRLDSTQCLYIGSSSQDPGFARKMGFQYRDAAEFFGASRLVDE
jgi:predicted kinase